MKRLSRRNFLSSAALGMGTLAISHHQVRAEGAIIANNDPRLVNLSSVSVMDLTAMSTADMVRRVLAVMEKIVPYRPDIICLPEGFAYTNIPGNNYQLKDVAENVPGAVVTPFLNFARTHKCYIICPTYTNERGNHFISAVLIDRQGSIAGVYHKMRPAESELEMGVRPGKSNPPVFQTDFGKIGIQICFDVKYDDGWNALKEKGAQIIFWPSAYAAGQEISSRAWKHQVYIVTSTQKDTSRICDLSGETIAQTGRWQRNWVFAPVNLEKAFIHSWPAVSLFPDIQKKYGGGIRLNTYHEEEWTIIESLDPKIKVADVLKEFKLKTMHESLKELAAAHEKARNGKK